ncbi:MAG: succinate dehydrogenase, hydrophobic membrane anchor protein [Pseudomonadales bacterium]
MGPLSIRNRGLFDFVLQRASAVVLGLYTFCMLGFLLSHRELPYVDWVGFFRSVPMMIFSTVSLVSLCVHAWIGMWTIGTDYIRPLSFGKRSTFLRQGYQALIVALLLIYLAWGSAIIWGLG